MRPVRLLVIFLLAPLAGCVTGYTLVEPGVQTLGPMRVTAGELWNRAPGTSTRANGQTWTQDGLLLDRLIIIPGVKDGETLFVSTNAAQALPAFHADMLPNEVQELVESSILKMFGEGSATVSTSGLRPQGFGDIGGFMFDLEAAVSESPNYRGLVGAFVDDSELYVVMFLAAEPHYFDKHKGTADALIRSATLTRPAIPKL